MLIKFHCALLGEITLSLEKRNVTEKHLELLNI